MEIVRQQVIELYGVDIAVFDLLTAGPSSKMDVKSITMGEPDGPDVPAGRS